MKEKLLPKIKALLDKAESAKQMGSLAEAETFMVNANKLLLKYNLSMTDISNLSEKNENDITKQEEDNFIKLGVNKAEGTWDEQLIKMLTRNNFCDVVFMNFSKKCYIVGTKTNIEIVEYLFGYLKQIIPVLGNEKYTSEVERIRNTYYVQANKNGAEKCFNKAYPEFGKVEFKDLMPTSYAVADEEKIQNWKLKTVKLAGLEDRGVYLRSFLLGAVRGIDQKLRAEMEQIVREDAPECTALMVQSLVKRNKKEVREFLEKEGVRFVQSRGERPSSQGGFSSGVETGKGMSLNKGIKSSIPKTLQLN